MIARIDIDGCDRSGGCPAARVCPRGAVVRIEDGRYRGAWTIDEARCTGCGACVRVCPTRSIALFEE